MKIFNKLISWLVLALVFIPAVKADWYEVQDVLYNLFGWGYYNDSGFVLLKLGIFVVLFSLLQMATKKIFKENSGAANVVAIVISFMSVLFIPPEFIVNIGSISGVIGVLIVVGALLFLPHILLDIAGFKSKWVYAIILIVELFALQALAQNVYYNNPILDYILSGIGSISFWETVGIAVLIILAVFGFSHFRHGGGGGNPVASP